MKRHIATQREFALNDYFTDVSGGERILLESESVQRYTQGSCTRRPYGPSTCQSDGPFPSSPPSEGYGLTDTTSAQIGELVTQTPLNGTKRTDYRRLELTDENKSKVLHVS